jgi:hypothetical protein
MFSPPIALVLSIAALGLGQAKAYAIPGLAISGLTSLLFFWPIVAKLVCL